MPIWYEMSVRQYEVTVLGEKTKTPYYMYGLYTRLRGLQVFIVRKIANFHSQSAIINFSSKFISRIINRWNIEKVTKIYLLNCLLLILKELYQFQHAKNKI